MGGKPAARMLIDTGAHTGPVMKGSHNVLIGGKPAARVGDPITCSGHGQCSIIEGSATVLINGKPAARKEDKTSCGGPTPPEDAAAPPAITNYNCVSPAPHHDDGSLINSSGKNNDGAVQNSNNPVSAKAFAACYNTGVNYQEAGAALVDITANGKGPLGTGVEGGLSAAKVDVRNWFYNGDGMYGERTDAKATAVEITQNSNLGQPGDPLYASQKFAEGFGYARRERESILYAGGPGRKYGFQAESKVEAAAVKMEQEYEFGRGSASYTRIKTTKTALGVGAGIRAGGNIDTDDLAVTIDFGLSGALGVGGSFEIEHTYSIKPIVDFFNGDNSFMDMLKGKSKPAVAVIEGKILTGCATVLIG